MLFDKKYLKSLFYVFLLSVLVIPHNLFCAKISGYVADDSKGAIAGTPPPANLCLQGVTVSLTGKSTQTYVTGGSGYFEFLISSTSPAALGRYTVTLSSAGRIFQPGNQSYNITSGTQEIVTDNFSGVEYMYIAKWGASGTSYGNFSSPSGVAVSSLSCVLVADTGNHRVQRFASTGTATASEFKKWGEEESADSPVSSDSLRGFNQPYDVAVDSAGWLYVADTFNNRVQKFDPETYDKDTDTSNIYNDLTGASTTSFNLPSGICADNKNNVFYVADTGNNRILQFSSTGIYISEWGGAGSGNGQFAGPKDVAVHIDEDDTINIYVVDTGNHRIQKFIDNSGSIDFNWKWVTGPGSANGQFNTPSSIAVDLEGNVYVADTGNERVQKLSSTGVYITKWGYNGTGDGKFVTPFGVAVDSQNCVYVSERGNHRVQKFEPAASFVNIKGYAAFESASGAKIESVTLSLDGVDPVYCYSIVNSTIYVTGPDGYFEFLNLPVNGNYTITPSSAGYLFAPVTFSTNSIKESISDLYLIAFSSIVIQKYTIQGRITQRDSDPSDQPVETEVDLYLNGTWISSTTSGPADGSYAFDQVPDGGNYTVKPVSPVSPELGFDPTSRNVASLSADITGWDFSGFLVTSIKGHVLDRSGTGLADVTLNLSESATVTTLTDSSGYYEFLGLPKNGHYTVTPVKLDYTFDPLQLYFTNEQLPTDTADFTASYSTPTLTNLAISGYVREAGGTGINSVTVSMYDGSTTTAVTDSAGYFKFSDLTGRKNYKLTPEKLNWVFVPASSTTYLNTSSKEDENGINFIATFLYTEAPPKIDIPLGANGTPVQVQLPPAGSAKVIVEERPGKAAKYRGTVNPDNSEAVGIMFKPSLSSADYVNKKFTIRIFTLKGELVDEFSKTPQTADDVWIKWIPRNLASGIYIVHVEGPGVKSTKKIAVLK